MFKKRFIKYYFYKASIDITIGRNIKYGNTNKTTNA